MPPRITCWRDTDIGRIDTNSPLRINVTFNASELGVLQKPLFLGHTDERHLPAREGRLFVLQYD
ncbi:hypothetical protein Y043_302 [Burkholderia pseudomallei MSHR2138]|nr:hypothetical protein Y043_302 [Burkholderia pseudomallei MSHR2138]